MSWYSSIISISHLGKQARIPAQQGLRQGCQLAPSLWAMAVGCIAKEVATSSLDLPSTWLQENMTTYADDIHLKECCRSIVHLNRTLNRFGLVLDALTKHDMVVNTAKSAILIRHRGNFVKAWLRRHHIAVKGGHVLKFRSPKGQEYQIPVKEQHTYLGCHTDSRQPTWHGNDYGRSCAHLGISSSAIEFPSGRPPFFRPSCVGWLL